LKLTEEGVNQEFAPDLPSEERALLYTTQGPVAYGAFTTPATNPAWATKPSWFIVASNDRVISPALEQSEAQRMRATTISVETIHVAMLADPDRVAAFIELAAEAAGQNLVEGPMSIAKWNLLIVAAAVALPFIEIIPGLAAKDDEATQAQIARALAAAPSSVATGARVVGTDSGGNRIVLREGTNGFTCMPGNPAVVGEPAMCMDAASMQWAADFKAHKPKPTNTVPGITYMLAGATQRIDSDPYDTTSSAITVGPHWMIMWPFDPLATGLPVTHKATGA
jgi:hypothetical protein